MPTPAINKTVVKLNRPTRVVPHSPAPKANRVLARLGAVSQRIPPAPPYVDWSHQGGIPLSAMDWSTYAIGGLASCIALDQMVTAGSYGNLGGESEWNASVVDQAYLAANNGVDAGLTYLQLFNPVVNSDGPQGIYYAGLPSTGVDGNGGACCADSMDLGTPSEPLLRFAIWKFGGAIVNFWLPAGFLATFMQGDTFPVAAQTPQDESSTTWGLVTDIVYLNGTVYYRLFWMGTWCYVSFAFLQSVAMQWVAVLTARQFRPNGAYAGYDGNGQHITESQQAWTQVLGGAGFPLSTFGPWQFGPAFITAITNVAITRSDGSVVNSA
jgi:hypothetical protein